MHAKLFARIEAVHDRRDELPADAEERRLIERIHLDFVREGARLSAAAKTRYARDRRAPRASSPRDSCRTCWPTRRATGCRSSTSAISRACPTTSGRRRARRRRSAASTRRGSSRCPARSSCPSSRSRTGATSASRRTRPGSTRGEHDGAHDNRPIAREILALRNEQARLHGYRALRRLRAGRPDGRHARRRGASAAPGLGAGEGARGGGARRAARRWPRAQGATHAIEPWDWRYYAEKVRKARYRLDDGQLKPYFSLERMLAAAFDTAHRLFGLSLRRAARTSRRTTPTSASFEVRGADDADGRRLPERQLRAPEQARRRVDERLSLAVARRTARRCPSSSTTTISRRGRPARRRSCRPTICARCSTSSGTGCTASCRR